MHLGQPAAGRVPRPDVGDLGAGMARQEANELPAGEPGGAENADTKGRGGIHGIRIVMHAVNGTVNRTNGGEAYPPPRGPASPVGPTPASGAPARNPGKGPQVEILPQEVEIVLVRLRAELRGPHAVLDAEDGLAGLDERIEPVALVVAVTLLVQRVVEVRQERPDLPE